MFLNKFLGSFSLVGLQYFPYNPRIPTVLQYSNMYKVRSYSKGTPEESNREPTDNCLLFY